MQRHSTALTQILCDLSAGLLGCDEARRRIESGPEFQFPKSEFVVAYLAHYLDDEGLRKRDPDYAAMQNAELNKLISRLQDSDYEGAAKVTFLGVS